MDLVVIALGAPAAPEGARSVACADAEAMVAALAGPFDAAVLVSDGLPSKDLERLSEAVVACGRPVIEVRSERWDGQSPSPLSAACRGVISGFGEGGVAAAVGVLKRG
jgi:hypothetical protein